MTEASSGEQILKRLDEIAAKLDAVLAALASRVPEPSPLDVLPLDDAAAYIGVAPYTLRTGKAGTRSIPRHTNRPVQFLRASLDQWKRGAFERERQKLQPKAKTGRAVPSLVRRAAKKRP